MLIYRVSDAESANLTYRESSWQLSDSGVPATWSDKTYGNGAHSIDECLFANGYEQPATSIRSVVAQGVEVERSNFEVLDPAFYPFLRRLPPPGAEPAACAGASIDPGELIAGKDVSLTAWSDTGYARVTMHPEQRETITVPAGTYDSLRITQELDVSDYVSNLPSLLRRFISTPATTNWISRAPPYYELKATRADSGAEANRVKELTEVVDHPRNSPSAILSNAQQVPPDPLLTLVNAGRVTQGDRSGRVTMSTAKTTEGELLVVRVLFANGLVTENRTLLDPNPSPHTRYMEERVYAPDGKLVRRRLLYSREAAFPEEPAKELPPDLHSNTMTLAIILPRLLSDSSGTVILRAMGFGGGIIELVLQGSGYETVDLDGVSIKAVHAHLRPNLQIPLLLRPIAYFFIPQYDIYFEEGSLPRLLKFDGPLGPPGSPDAHLGNLCTS